MNQNMMNETSHCNHHAQAFRRALAHGLTVLAFLFSGTTFAGDLTALSWEEDSSTSALQVWVSGEPAYTVETLDGGQRLR